MNVRAWLAALLMVVLPSTVLAQGRIAVVNLEQAILQTGRRAATAAGV